MQLLSLDRPDISKHLIIKMPNHHQITHINLFKFLYTTKHFLLIILLSAWLSACGDSGSEGVSNKIDTALSDLNISTGQLDQVFQTSFYDYSATVGFLGSSIKITAIANNPADKITINGNIVLSGSPSPAILLAEGNNNVTIMVTSPDNSTTQAYSLNILRESLTFFAEQAYIKASNNEEFHNFGYSVAIDGNTMVIGAPGGDSFSSSPAAVYVFTRLGASWNEATQLIAQHSPGGDSFGFSVDIYNDTIVVGIIDDSSNTSGINSTPNIDGLADRSGAAYVFTHTNNSWIEQAYIKASNPGANDWFGYDVAIYNDTLVVGSPFEDSNGTGINSSPNDDGTADDSGAAYVYKRTGSTWSEQTYIKASNSESNDNFGYSVAVDNKTIVVGARHEDSSSTGVNSIPTDDGTADNSGAAYVYTLSGNIWSQDTYLKASNTAVGDRFGISVAIDNNTIVVGADLGDLNSIGSAYVFTRTNNIWSEQAYLTSSNAGQNDWFGISVAIDEDTLAIGAYSENSNSIGINSMPNDDGSTDNSGAVYIFTRSNNLWTEQAYIKAGNVGAGDLLGHAVSIAGDTLVVGAYAENSNSMGINSVPNDDGTATLSGAVYIFQ